jgi:hypothetical protein
VAALALALALRTRPSSTRTPTATGRSGRGGDLMVKAMQPGPRMNSGGLCSTWESGWLRRWSCPTAGRRHRQGTSKGSVVARGLANLFLHCAVNLWMARAFPDCPFERYTDDQIIGLSSPESMLPPPATCLFRHLGIGTPPAAE